MSVRLYKRKPLIDNNELILGIEIVEHYLDYLSLYNGSKGLSAISVPIKMPLKDLKEIYLSKKIKKDDEIEVRNEFKDYELNYKFIDKWFYLNIFFISSTNW